MDALRVFLLVLFIIVSILLVLLVLIQNEEGDSLGGVFAGGSNTAFGSRSGNVLTKASTVLGALFFILSFSLAMLNRSPVDSRGIEEAGRRSLPQTEEASSLEDFAPKSTGAQDAIPPVSNDAEPSSEVKE
ncbi:MAG: preprotein translocase subunit SecG [Spirochaetaceae bacterium]|jgi:preprotein translocase subunit SecG|nr:preprotein translocase subunit SecG [Spirochaetaceae bacterium]GMO16190.1 MAG: hypothetical protein Pg6A_02430 [Termitinemataceae bacterium]